MIRLAVRCAPEQAELVLAELVDLVPGGVEEERGETYVEYAIYGPPGELPELPEIEAAAGEGRVEIETTEIPDDWADRWRDFHHPISIGGRLVVRPSWERGGNEDAGEAIEIVIDPGRAFGTGAHATTAMCLGLLLGLADEDRRGRALADLGTGSGVLAIAAAKLGFEPVLGCDHELPAIAAATANAELNEVDVGFERINLREQPPPPAQVWTANLTAPLLIGIAAAIEPAGRLPDQLVLSGMLVSEAERVASSFAGAGFSLGARSERGDWAALRLGR